MIRIIDSSKVLKRSKYRDRNFHRSFYESQIYLQIPSLNIQQLVQYGRDAHDKRRQNSNVFES